MQRATEARRPLPPETSPGECPADAPIIRHTRTFAAPPALVWSAWTDPERVSRWWGPDGFTTTTAEWDLRPGGRWIFTMHGPDGSDYPNLVTFDAVEPPTRLAYRHRGDGEITGDVAFESTVSFAEIEGGTRVTMTLRFPDLAARDRVVAEFGALEGGRQTLARLAALLAEEVPLAEPVVRVSRAMPAPPAAVWAAWTDPARVTEWWGPHGFSTTTHAHDLRPGGTWRFTMHRPDGRDHESRVVFETVDPPQRLAYAHYAAGDPEGRPHFHADVAFAPYGDGGTRVTLTMAFPTVGDRDALLPHGIVEGGRDTLARFAALLARA
jgi:uncharacterized protein YndB with AHSA1/START domain